jgi:hypothetical protein
LSGDDDFAIVSEMESWINIIISSNYICGVLKKIISLYKRVTDIKNSWILLNIKLLKAHSFRTK